MALTGSTSVKVSKKPVVSVISSGNELVEPLKNQVLSQIRNTNSYQLMAQMNVPVQLENILELQGMMKMQHLK